MISMLYLDTITTVVVDVSNTYPCDVTEYSTTLFFLHMLPYKQNNTYREGNSSEPGSQILAKV